MFQEIFGVFLALGTLVGVIVIGYMLYNAYKYRADGGAGEGKVEERPQLGEIPTGGGGGRKLFLSFTLSAIIVISLVAWTYGTLLYVEGNASGPDEPADLTVEVVGHQFLWEFIYPNNHSSGTLYVPEGAVVRVEATSADVFHTFGIPDLRVKADAIPGQTTSSWFQANETGNYTAHCYELCGSAHSYMDAEVVVLSQEEYDDWYAETGGSENATETNASQLAEPTAPRERGTPPLTPGQTPPAAALAPSQTIAADGAEGA